MLAVESGVNYVGTRNRACAFPSFSGPHSCAHSACRFASESGGIGADRAGVDRGLAHQQGGSRDPGRRHLSPPSRFAVHPLPVLRLGAVVGIVAAIFLTGVPSQVIAAGSLQATADDGTVVTATYEGLPIDPRTASRYFCHTRDYPAVRCFASQAEVDEDLGWVEPTAPGNAAEAARSNSSDVSPTFPQVRRTRSLTGTSTTVVPR